MSRPRNSSESLLLCMESSSLVQADPFLLFVRGERVEDTMQTLGFPGEARSQTLT